VDKIENSWKNGKYALDTETIAEVDFDMVAKAKSPYANSVHSMPSGSSNPLISNQ
jgi:hypothetical protein